MFAGEEKGGLGERREVVYRVDIKDEIGPGIWRLVKRSFDRATDENADVILVHMNTYGGMVVYADSLRSLILNYPKPVWYLHAGRGEYRCCNSREPNGGSHA